jgi:hypothetical protein
VLRGDLAAFNDVSLSEGWDGGCLGKGAEERANFARVGGAFC